MSRRRLRRRSDRSHSKLSDPGAWDTASVLHWKLPYNLLVAKPIVQLLLPLGQQNSLRYSPLCSLSGACRDFPAWSKAIAPRTGASHCVGVLSLCRTCTSGPLGQSSGASYLNSAVHDRVLYDAMGRLSGAVQFLVYAAASSAHCTGAADPGFDVRAKSPRSGATVSFPGGVRLLVQASFISTQPCIAESLLGGMRAFRTCRKTNVLALSGQLPFQCQLVVSVTWRC